MFTKLPSQGLQKLLHLKTFNNAKLRELPDPDFFPRIQVKIYIILILQYYIILTLFFTESGSILRISLLCIFTNSSRNISAKNSFTRFNHISDSRYGIGYEFVE